MRLTYEIGHKGTKQYDTDSTNDWKAINKLGQLEDIEEELGIDLIILFKALKNGVYYFEGNQITHDKVHLYSNYLGVCFDKLSYSFMTFFRKYLFAFKDYGKTWALTKEELE